jgi:hypothetical protein
MRISAYFFGRPGDAKDQACTRIFEFHNGREIGRGTMMLGPGAGERDVEYEVPDHLAQACQAELQVAGYRLEPVER